MISKIKKGKILWYSKASGEGMLVAQDGANIYFHFTSLIKNPKEYNIPTHSIKDGTPVKYTTYENGYLRQVYRIYSNKIVKNNYYKELLKK